MANIFQETAEGLRRKKVQKALAVLFSGAILFAGIEQSNWWLVGAGLIFFVKFVA